MIYFYFDFPEKNNVQHYHKNYLLMQLHRLSALQNRYYQNLMFDKKMLNLRNNIAHGISTIYDYLSLSFVGVMVQMIWDIGANDVIMGYEFR